MLGREAAAASLLWGRESESRAFCLLFGFPSRSPSADPEETPREVQVRQATKFPGRKK